MIRIQIGASWTCPFWLSSTPTFQIVTATDATPVVVTTNGNHGFTDGVTVVAGQNSNADGAWVAENVGANTVALTSSVATGFGTLAGGVIAQTMDATGGSITFTPANATWAVGQSIIAPDGLLVASFAPAVTWTSVATGNFTLSLTAAQTFALQSGIYVMKIYFTDASSNVTYFLETRVEVTTNIR